MFDAEGDALSLEELSVGAGASVTQIDDLAFTFTPDQDFDGSVAVTYSVTDGNLVSNEATIDCTVTPVNDAPVANGESFTVAQDETLFGDLLANDTDVDGDDLTIISANGVATRSVFMADSSGGREAIVVVEVSGDPNVAIEQMDIFADQAEGETDTISFDYTISDGNGGTDTTTFELIIEGVNDAPVLDTVGPFMLDENTTEAGTITASDIDSTDLSFSIIGGDDASLFEIDADTGALSFADAPDFENPGDVDCDSQYEVQVEVSDGSLTDDAFVFVNVGDVDEVPGLNLVVGTTGRDFLVGTEGNDQIVFNGGFGDVGIGAGGDDVFDFTENVGNGERDNTRIVDWSDGDTLIGFDVSNANMDTIRSSETTLRFTYGEDNDVLTITGDASNGLCV